MERVLDDDHPLSSKGSSTRLSISTTISQGSYQPRSNFRTPSAALIQSAVRSVLDDATPGSIVSDDRSDGGSFLDDPVNRHNFFSPGLESLQIEPLPPLPDEQDRKRFIGCLAAVLASAYSYEESDKEITSDVSSSNDSFAYLDYVEDDPEHDNDGSLSHARSSLSNSAEESSDHENPLDEATMKKQLDQSMKRSSNVSTGSLHPQNWGEKGKTKDERSKQRTRRRRYNICCELLMSSAELMLLEKSVARGFIPMLSRILVPPTRPQKGNKPLRANLPVSGKRRSTSHSAPSSPGERSRLSLPPMTKVSSFTTYPYEAVELRTETGPVDNEEEKDYRTEEVDKEDVLRPFLESMTPGSGFRCLAMLLLQHLLTSKVGYDARVRHVLKKLGVLALVHDMGVDPVEQELLHGSGQRSSLAYRETLTHATRKFEALERSIARRLIRLSDTSPNQRASHETHIVEKNKLRNSGLTTESILRGVKIGSVVIVAGTLFALTGGLAAPGIAAGIAAVAGSTAAATAAVMTLTSTAVVTTIFGVGGGSLAAYKMQRRTQGLTEFEFRKEFTDRNKVPSTATSSEGQVTSKSEIEAELFTTICISGWLRDRYDYQRPWGLHPTRPRLTDRMELLERFYSVVRPDHVPNCARILSDWQGDEKRLWGVLRDKYGRDPDHLFPLDDGPRLQGNLTLEQEEALDLMFVELGYNSVAPSKDVRHKSQRTPLERMREGWNEHRRQRSHQGSSRRFDSMHGPSSAGDTNQNGTRLEGVYQPQDTNERVVPNDSSTDVEYQPPKHLATVWDYKTTYGGELYTVRWESELLTTICDCVMDLAMDVVSGATRQILKATILSTLLAAVVLPSYLLNVANMIDGDWTLAVERADEAGAELARTLLMSRAGQRPVTLVGFSFGARVIYACLKELARLQDEWEDLQEIQKKEGKWTATEQLIHAKLVQKFNGMREPASVVEDAIMMGLPNHLSLSSWKACRQVVGGRLVNCYSTKDLILSLMFQAKRFSPGVQSILKPVCGTCEVNEAGVENIDVSDLVHGHQDYCLLTGKILERVKIGEPLRQEKFNRDETKLVMRREQ